MRKMSIRHRLRSMETENDEMADSLFFFAPANAPASQMWVLAVVGASLATWSMHWKDHMVLDRLSVFNWAIWRGATSPFVAMSVPELIMSIVMLQQMRTIERRMGTNKFAVRTHHSRTRGADFNFFCQFRN